MTAALQPVRVAVVDDSEDLRVLVELHLALDERFELTAEAADGNEAIELITRNDIDAMILDMHMPGCSGRDVLRALRAAHSTIRVVAFSADAELLRRAAREGAAATVLKGENLDRLVAALLPATSVA